MIREKKLQLCKQHSTETVFSLENILAQSSPAQLKSSQAPAIIQINLLTNQIGIKKPNDKNGLITILQCPPEKVIQIAELVHAQLNSVKGFYDKMALLEDRKLPVDSGLQIVNNIKNDPYSSTELYFLAAKSLRISIAKQETDSTITNTESVAAFRKEFDDKYYLFFSNTHDQNNEYQKIDNKMIFQKNVKSWELGLLKNQGSYKEDYEFN